MKARKSSISSARVDTAKKENVSRNNVYSSFLRPSSSLSKVSGAGFAPIVRTQAQKPKTQQAKPSIPKSQRASKPKQQLQSTAQSQDKKLSAGAKPFLAKRKSTSNLTKEAILSGRTSCEPSTSMLIEELFQQRKSSRSIIDAKNKLIAEMARKIGEQSKNDTNGLHHQASIQSSSDEKTKKKPVRKHSVKAPKSTSTKRRSHSKSNDVCLEKQEEPLKATPFSVKQEALVNQETTQKFLSDTYKKLRQLEDDIQRRKEKEAQLTRERQKAFSQLDERLYNAREVTSSQGERGRIQFSFEDSPSPQKMQEDRREVEDSRKQVRFQSRESQRSKSRASSAGSRSAGVAANNQRQTPTRAFQKKELYAKAQPVNMSLSMHVRKTKFVQGFDQVETPTSKRKSHKDQKSAAASILSPCLKKQEPRGHSRGLFYEKKPSQGSLRNIKAEITSGQKATSKDYAGNLTSAVALSPHSAISTTHDEQTDQKEMTLQKIQEFRREIREVKDDLESINVRQHSMNNNQIGNLALCNLKSNFDALQNNNNIATDRQSPTVGAHRSASVPSGSYRGSLQKQQDRQEPVSTRSHHSKQSVDVADQQKTLDDLCRISNILSKREHDSSRKAKNQSQPPDQVFAPIDVNQLLHQQLARKSRASSRSTEELRSPKVISQIRKQNTTSYEDNHVREAHNKHKAVSQGALYRQTKLQAPQDDARVKLDMQRQENELKLKLLKMRQQHLRITQAKHGSSIGGVPSRENYLQQRVSSSSHSNRPQSFSHSATFNKNPPSEAKREHYLQESSSVLVDQNYQQPSFQHQYYQVPQNLGQMESSEHSSPMIPYNYGQDLQSVGLATAIGVSNTSHGGAQQLGRDQSKGYSQREKEGSRQVNLEMQKRLVQLKVQRMVEERDAKLQGMQMLAGQGLRAVQAGTVSSDGYSGFHNQNIVNPYYQQAMLEQQQRSRQMNRIAGNSASSDKSSEIIDMSNQPQIQGLALFPSQMAFQ